MDDKTLKQLRAQAIEIDRAIMMIHSALGGIIRIIEKRGTLEEVQPTPNADTATVTVLPEKKI